MQQAKMTLPFLRKMTCDNLFCFLYGPLPTVNKKWSATFFLLKLSNLSTNVDFD